MKQAVKLSALALASAFLVGCATIVEYQLAQRPQNFKLDHEVDLSQFNFSEREFCLPHLGGCTGYILGHPATAEDDKYTMKMDIEVDDVDYQTELVLKRDEIPLRKGTVVLLHGYGVDKRATLMLGLHFRFLGYHTIAPDLTAHGDSRVETPSYGVTDAQMLSTLIDSLPAREVPKPLHIMGISMGAVAAAHLAKQRDDVTSVMLLAPMRPLNEASRALAQLTLPNLSRLLPAAAFDEGVTAALQKQGLTVADTDLRELIPELGAPVFIAASDKDEIAPYEFFLPLESEQVELVMRPGYHHLTTAIPDAELHAEILEWLQQVE